MLFLCVDNFLCGKSFFGCICVVIKTKDKGFMKKQMGPHEGPKFSFQTIIATQQCFHHPNPNVFIGNTNQID
jgi:hypothetical protein